MRSLQTLGVGATLVSVAHGIGAAALAEPIGELNPVVVSATADSLTQASLQSARDNLKTVPGGVWVEDLNSAREGRQSTWRDSLGLVPGVYIQDRFGSEESRISIRGSALSRTYHSFGIKVLQDGVPINYADGFFDMLTVDANAARYVEVLRGPNATTYGATTLGGAIHFVSPTGSSQPGSVVRTEAGSFGYQKLFGSTAGVIQNDREGAPVWDYHLAGTQSQQHGFRDHADMANQKLLANFGASIHADLETRFYVASVHSRSQLPGYLTLQEMRQNPTQAASNVVGGVYPYRVEANRRRDVDAQRWANKTTLRDGHVIYEFAAYAMSHDLWHPIDTIVAQHTQTAGGHLKATVLLDQHQWTWAYLPSVGSTHGTSQPTNNQGAATGVATSNYDQQSHNSSLYVEDRYRSSERTTWTAALQQDRARRHVSDVVLASNQSDHRYGQWSPRLGVTHDIDPTQQWFTSLSRNFEAPIFGLTGTSTTANLAQTGVTWEVGTRGTRRMGRHRWSWDATYYRARLNNEFLSVCSDPNCTSAPTTTNVPKSQHQGLELGLTHALGRHLETRLAMLYSDFKFVHHPVYGNNALPGFAPLLWRGEVLYRWGSEVQGKPSLYAGPKFEWVPRKAPMDSANTIDNPGYALLGFKAGQSINAQWSWFVDARNMTNRTYAATTNIAANYAAVPGDGRRYYPGDGRSVYLGVEAKLAR